MLIAEKTGNRGFVALQVHFKPLKNFIERRRLGLLSAGSLQEGESTEQDSHDDQAFAEPAVGCHLGTLAPPDNNLLHSPQAYRFWCHSHALATIASNSGNLGFQP